MPAGVPKISADSKLSTPRMNDSRKALVVTGSMSPSVTRRKVVHGEAPDMRLDSSSAGSIDLKAPTMQEEEERRRVLHHVPHDAAVGVDVDERLAAGP